MFKDGTRIDWNKLWLTDSRHGSIKPLSHCTNFICWPRSMRQSKRVHAAFLNDPAHDLQLGLAGLQCEMASCIDLINYLMLLMYLPIQVWLCRWAACQQAVIVEAPGMWEPFIFLMSSYTHLEVVLCTFRSCCLMSNSSFKYKITIKYTFWSYLFINLFFF